MIKLLNSELELSNDSVENLIMKPMKVKLSDPSNCVGLDQELSKILISIQIAELSGDKSLMDIYKKSLTADWRLEAIKRRIDTYFQYKMTPAAMLLFQLMACDYSIGAWIMFITYLQYYCKCENIREVDSKVLCMAFKNGLLKDQIQKDIWYNTKVYDTNSSVLSDNLIDYPIYFKSIMFE